MSAATITLPPCGGVAASPPLASVDSPGAVASSAAASEPAEPTESTELADIIGPPCKSDTEARKRAKALMHKHRSVDLVTAVLARIVPVGAEARMMRSARHRANETFEHRTTFTGITANGNDLNFWFKNPQGGSDITQTTLGSLWYKEYAKFASLRTSFHVNAMYEIEIYMPEIDVWMRLMHLLPRDVKKLDPSAVETYIYNTLVPERDEFNNYEVNKNRQFLAARTARAWDMFTGEKKSQAQAFCSAAAYRAVLSKHARDDDSDSDDSDDDEDDEDDEPCSKRHKKSKPEALTLSPSAHYSDEFMSGFGKSLGSPPGLGFLEDATLGEFRLNSPVARAAISSVDPPPLALGDPHDSTALPPLHASEGRSMMDFDIPTMMSSTVLPSLNSPAAKDAVPPSMLEPDDFLAPPEYVIPDPLLPNASQPSPPEYLDFLN